MTRTLAALAAAVIAVLTLTGCGAEDEYVKATTDNATYQQQLPFDEDAQLAFGHGICTALDGDENVRDAYALDKSHHGWTKTKRDRATMDWQVQQATKYLCPEHDGETIDWYTVHRIDAAGRASSLSSIWNDWVPYAPDHVDNATHTIVRPTVQDIEKRWLDAHPTMPKLRSGFDLTYHVLDDSWDDIGRLTDVRVLNGRNGDQTLRAYGVDPDEGADALGRAVETNPNPSVDGGDGMHHLRVVRTVPAAGKPVGLKGITIVVAWDFDAWDNDGDGIPNADDDTPYGVYIGTGGDDDFNIPGWLCPTRFC